MYILKNKLMSSTQALLAKAGVQVVSLQRQATEANIMGALLAEAATPLHSVLKSKGQIYGTGVVFSFNRPMQLELLLRSYFKLATNPQPLVVQYGAKGEAFSAAYGEVARLYPQVRFVPETKFKDSFIATLKAITTPNLFFLVDDIVFTRPTDMAEFCALDTQTYIPSLRLAPTLGFSYTAQAKAPPPTFSPGPNGMLAFNWNETPYEWSYPMSVDGHLFNTAEMQVLSRILPYKAPNSFEGALMRIAPSLCHRQGLCFAAPKILNNPCNKVQSEVANKAGNITPESLLTRWQNGEHIALEPFADYPNTSPHTEVPLRFEPRGTAAKTKRKTA